MLPRFIALRALGLLVIAVLSAGLFVAVAPAPAAQAADARDFDAGEIVSDANFYSTSTMTAGDVQNFLNTKGNRCSRNCLKDYVTTTVAKSAESALCSGYQGGVRQTAAQIIDGVARSCGISQKVLLVLLEKEQSLVTMDNPSAGRYQAATGQGCPDTAACDSAYYGLFNQIYGAARQFKIYQKYADSYWYKAGMTNSILYSPNQSCGRKSVYIVNQATAALYIYTPYTPNDAALRAQWGEGDGCSAYGNRNFFLFWSTWFGDPTASLPEAEIQAVRDANPSLGASTSGVECNDARTGCQQRFASGGVFWTTDNGAKKVDGGIWGLYQQSGQQNGYLGYPTDTATWSTVNQGGWIQNFQLGAIYWSSVAGGRIVSSSIFAEYQRWGGPSGDLGWPMTDQSCGLPRGGCSQVFQNGEIFWSAGGGTWAVRGGIKQSFDALGGVGGTIGYPTGPEQYRTVNGTGWVQGFEGGAIYWRNGWGIHMFGGIRDAYAAAGYSDGRLGWPVSVQSCGSSGCRQDFQNGTILWTATGGTHVVDGAIFAQYSAQGFEKGRMGYPTTDALPRSGNGDGIVQGFTGGAIYLPPASDTAIQMFGAIRDEYARQNYNWGPLGWPTGAQVCGLDRGGCVQPFDGGSIYWTSSLGAVRVDKAVAVPYAARGAEKGVLGYPTGPTQARDGNGVGVAQGFEKGALYVKDGKDILLSGPIRDEYARQGYNAGTLGWPRADAVCKLTGGGCKQQFDTGWIVWSPNTAAVRIDGGLLETWTSLGAEGGQLGYPTTAAYPRAGGGWSQDFEHGTISWTGARGGFVEGAASSTGARSAAPSATPTAPPTVSPTPSPTPVTSPSATPSVSPTR
ncbi:MAG: hypothetical protein BGO45_00655 [Microbacterium sp. 71-36]|uniref:hypothetical protein n=1 Tax=unclassified Microbacterium TaxID=2609290 RepID=UPI00086BA590|nr:MULTISPECIES: hypothetical protein [unclassified Microbacterium]MBN9210081.1 hypothetical protein [Microbacterium sp.]ODT39798.1 MAG: hypothetical protein ABS60_05750 [Microbacterium sp. SCN 71-17]OJV76112.1 MAG: hypothetical protein BGO45_00655 [Microbacterium sp. 71-36]